MTWFDAAGGYQVRLDGDGTVRCRNSKGKELSTVPASLRDDPQVTRLRQLVEWLQRHEAECREVVDRWMVRSLPVPTSVVIEVWPDPAWQAALRDLVVTVNVGDGAQEGGFLRDADPDRGIGVVTLDGETRRLRPELVAIPHPVLLAELDEFREFAAELNVEQRVQQLFRQTWALPSSPPTGATDVTEFAGGKFAQLRHVLGRCRSLGYLVRGGYAVYRVFEHGRVVEAQYWVGSDDPEWETYTGDLSWSLADGSTLALADVGRVAWSEGMRMASAVYAGRVVDEEAAA